MFTLEKTLSITMKQLIVCFSFVFIVSLSVYAQREVFFSTIPRDSVSISNTQGISIDFAALPSGVGASFELGYFKEKKMTKTTCLIIGGNIYLGQYVKSVITPGYSDSNRFVRTIYDYGFGMGLSAFAEPRWYFTYKNRYEKGRNVKLNTGCFVGLPLELNTSTLFTDSTDLKLNSQLTPILGYRLGFSQHFFMEISGGIGVSLFHLPGLQFSSHFKFKAAYTF